MISETTKEHAIRQNYLAFEQMLPGLMETSRGRYALLRDGQVAGVFETAAEAQRAGGKDFDDERFSVQRIEDKAVDLGFFSYAGYRRLA